MATKRGSSADGSEPGAPHEYAPLGAEYPEIEPARRERPGYKQAEARIMARKRHSQTGAERAASEIAAAQEKWQKMAPAEREAARERIRKRMPVGVRGESPFAWEGIAPETAAVLSRVSAQPPRPETPSWAAPVNPVLSSTAPAPVPAPPAAPGARTGAAREIARAIAPPAVPPPPTRPAETPRRLDRFGHPVLTGSFRPGWRRVPPGESP